MSVRACVLACAVALGIAACSDYKMEASSQMPQRMIETSTLLYSQDTSAQARTIEDIVSQLDQTLLQYAQTEGLHNVQFNTEPSKHWMKMSFVYGDGLYDWDLGIQFHRYPDRTGTRVDITMRYATSVDPFAHDNVNDIANKLGAALEKALSSS